MATKLSFSVPNFNALGMAAKRALYQEANETHDVDAVKQMNELGMKPDYPPVCSPSIISNFMDIGTKYNVILGFLKELRAKNKLLTETEFASLSNKTWVAKSDLGRILGTDHLMQKIRENNCVRAKVPEKIAVIQNGEFLKVKGSHYQDNLYDFDSDQIKIYAKKIEPVERKFSRIEIDELIKIIETANLVDFHPTNIIRTADGFYFIDNEFKSFAGWISWEKLERFLPLIEEIDKDYLIGEIRKKMKAQQEAAEEEENNGYHHFKSILKMYKSPKAAEDYSKKIEEIERKIAALELVGSKEAGARSGCPNEFSFPISDILN